MNPNNLNSSQSSKRRRCLFLILPFSTLLLLTLSISSFSPFTNHQLSLPLFPKNTLSHMHILKKEQFQTAKLHCSDALYHDHCVSTLTRIVPDVTSKSLHDIISAIVKETVTKVKSIDFNVTNTRLKVAHLSHFEKQALKDCHTLFLLTIDQLQEAIYDLLEKRYDDIRTLLSAAMTNQATCLDGLIEGSKSKKIRWNIHKKLKWISRQISNSLALLNKIHVRTTREVFPEYGDTSDKFPDWLITGDQELLEAETHEINYDLVVAKDGSGDFTTIGEALDAAPNSSKTRFVIYIKQGSYYEYLEVGKKKTMLMLVGDGIGKTNIKGNHNYVDGWGTFQSSTFVASGKSFIAKGITFENYAGPSKHQAVAVRVGADLSVFYQCSFVGYQDTLYIHSSRQFFRECNIYGTIDFVFGNSAAVFQKSSFYARKPDPNQKNAFTAQGREDPNQNTGISILDCKIAAGSELIPYQSMFKSYLGRPWKAYSRTVILRSSIGDLIEPRGYLEWDGDFALSTLYYGEYMNRGPGSNTSARVTWPGFKVITDSAEASQFTVGNFIQGWAWLDRTGVPYYLDLQQNLTAWI